MTYESLHTIATVTGLLILVAGFVVAAVYALWPGNRAKFERAARLPMLSDKE